MGSGGSILPWDDWIYHVNKLKHEVNTLHAEAVGYQDSIKSKVNSYNLKLKNAQQLLAGNAALLIIARTLSFNEQKLKDFEAQLQALPDPPKGCIPAKFGMFLSELVGTGYILKGIANIGKLVKSSLWTETSGEVGGEISGEVVGEGIAEGVAETATELGVEGGVEAGIGGALADTGVGIIAAVGLDAIFGAINGAKEKKELDEQIAKLRSAIAQLQKGNADIDAKFKQLDAKILEEEKRFLDLTQALTKVIPLVGEPVTIKVGDPIPKFLAEQERVLKFYGILANLRMYYIRAHDRNPNITKESIVTAVALSAKAEVTHEDVEKLYDIMLKYSGIEKK